MNTRIESTHRKAEFVCIMGFPKMYIPLNKYRNRQLSSESELSQKPNFSSF